MWINGREGDGTGHMLSLPLVSHMKSLKISNIFSSPIALRRVTQMLRGSWECSGVSLSCARAFWEREPRGTCEGLGTACTQPTPSCARAVHRDGRGRCGEAVCASRSHNERARVCCLRFCARAI